ncbi:hypothetical protein BGZ75_007598 [Mortierella antarctica]|nr:hypothetical protein BGZ75_007598 [Mortierella antarctica]
MEESKEIICTTKDNWSGVNLCPPTFDATNIVESHERFKRFAEDFAIGHDINPDELLQELAIINIEDISRTTLAIAVDVMENGTGDFWVRLGSKRDSYDIRDSDDSYEFETTVTCQATCAAYELCEEYSSDDSPDDSFQLEKRVPAEGKKADVKGAAVISAITMATAGATLM